MLCINSQWVAGHMTAPVMWAVGEFRVLQWCHPMLACIEDNKLWHPDDHLIWCPKVDSGPHRSIHNVELPQYLHVVFSLFKYTIVLKVCLIGLSWQIYSDSFIQETNFCLHPFSQTSFWNKKRVIN